MNADVAYPDLGVRRPSMVDLAQAVAQGYGVTVADLRGPCRRVRMNVARQDLMHRIYATGRFSMTQIGRFLGGRDHTTILNGIRRHEARQA